MQHKVSPGHPRGAPRQVDGAPRSSRPTSSAQAADRSLPRKRESSFPPLGLLSPRRPLRWVAAGAPLGAPGTAQRLSGPAGCPARAARGAAAPVTKAKKEPGVDARPVLALSVQLSAAMNPRTGGSRVGEAPRPFFLPISSGRNGGPGRAGPSREGHPGVRTWNPSSAPVCALGHLPPVGGRLRAEDIRPCGPGS